MKRLKYIGFNLNNIEQAKYFYMPYLATQQTQLLKTIVVKKIALNHKLLF